MGLSVVDALVIATGLELDADEVLTADRRWQSVDRRVRLI
jgi:predicted nucleic acid-binding protein